jgi:transcriptional regulator with XRE-family HTH domain
MGNKIKELRLEKHLSQAALARCIGISKAMISSYELEHRSPKYDVLIKIAAYFNVSTDYLLGLEKPSVNYDGLNEKEIKAVMNIVDIIRDK